MRWSLMTYTVNANQPGGLPGLAEIARFAREVEFAALELSARDLNDHTPEQRAPSLRRRASPSRASTGGDLATADEAALSRHQGRLELAEAAVTMACRCSCSSRSGDESRGQAARAAASPRARQWSPAPPICR